MDAQQLSLALPPDDPALARELAAGAVAGVVATLAMSTVMLGAQRIGLLGEQPPRKIADALLDELLPDADDQTRKLGTALVHLGIGAGGGAVHQIGRRVAGRPEPAVAWGAATGGAFWAVNYWVLAPLSGLMPPPGRDRPARPLVMLAAHFVWGAVSAAVGDALGAVKPRGLTTR
ncbi:MAG: hypothetical protein ABIV94_09200 [Acidimicrobiales bacterium]